MIRTFNWNTSLCTTMRHVFAPYIHRAVRMDLEPGISVIDFVWTLWVIRLRVPTAVKVSVVLERTWIQQQLASPVVLSGIRMG